MRWMLTDIDARRPALMDICEQDRRCRGLAELLVYVGTQSNDRCKAENSGLTIAPNLSFGVGV